MIIQQFMLALSFFTRIPLSPAKDLGSATLAQSAWAFPMVGAIIGSMTALAYNAALWLGMSHIIAAWLALGFCVLLTGGLHEDGLADMADGLASGRSREQKLAIMHDSHIGSYGTLALIITLSIRSSLIAEFNQGESVIWLLAATATTSRSMLAAALYYMPAARTSGLAATAGKPGYRCTVIAIFLGMLPLLFVGNILILGIAMAVLLAIGMLVRHIAQQHFGGITGDVLGALQQLSEIALLILLQSIAIQNP